MYSNESLDIATVCLSGTLEDKLVAAAAAGFTGVEIFENDLISVPWSPAEVRNRCADLGLRIDLYQPFRDFEAVPPEVFAANLRRAERKFDVMAALGADTMLVCSSVAPDAVDDDDLAAEQLRELASRAAERGLRIAYEALAWGRFVNTYDHSWRIVRRADHPALGVCLDSFHVLSRGSDLAAVRVIPGEKVFFLQLADAPHLHMDVLQWSRHHRLFPGQGAFDLTEFVGAVLATDYVGPLSLEVFNDVFRQSDPHRTAADAMRSLLSLQESLSARGPAAIRERVRVPELPAPPRLTGYTFAELTVDDTEAMTDMLSALGFTHVGPHQSTAAQLWQQGDARILLDTDTQAGARISSLAVESADPDTSARRAERLLAPTRGPHEVVTPDGTTVRFCRAGERFDTGVRVPDGPLTGIDHVSLTQGFDHFDEATLFYRTVFGLEPEPTAELAAPFGLIRSRAMSDPDRAVRLTLTVAALRRGDWAPAVPEPQHIAFRTNDILAAAQHARDRGAPVLRIPDNYYDDLDARLAPTPDLLTALREYSVLYDRDDNGAFLHFYTEIVGSRVFFEVVQRIGGYAGHGAVNAPIRMAAHRHVRLARVTDRTR